MQQDGICALNFSKLIEIGFTNCSICGKKIRALDDMKVKDAYYCTKCKMNIIDGESERDILLMRKNELLMELAEIDYRLDYIKTIFDL
jgi:DNA-directed RNA polymerase subunit RPC12/RpoP